MVAVLSGPPVAQAAWPVATCPATAAKYLVFTKSFKNLLHSLLHSGGPGAKHVGVAIGPHHSTCQCESLWRPRTHFPCVGMASILPACVLATLPREGPPCIMMICSPRMAIMICPMRAPSKRRTDATYLQTATFHKARAEHISALGHSNSY